MNWSYSAECAVYLEEPPTAECRRCGEVVCEDHVDVMGHCPDCQVWWDAWMDWMKEKSE